MKCNKKAGEWLRKRLDAYNARVDKRHIDEAEKKRLKDNYLRCFLGSLGLVSNPYISEETKKLQKNLMEDIEYKEYLEKKKLGNYVK